MLPASNRGAGMNMGFPDVCNTPAGPATVPVPYPNIAQNCQATPFSANVKISQMNALNLSSVIPITSGDEAGVAHPTIKGPGRFTQGNAKVKVNFMPAINLTSPSTGNNMNNGLGSQSVPCATNVFFAYATSQGRRFDGDALAAFASELASAPVEGRMFDDETGEVRIGLFGPSTAGRAEGLIDRLMARGARRLVLDLRGCRGGDLSAAIRLATDFVGPGTLIATMIDASERESPLRVDRPRRYDLPLVIRVDGGTASAAEVFAGAIQAHGRARLVGMRTYGKGTVHGFRPSSSGVDARYVPCATLTLPGGRSLDGVGLGPDIALAPSEPLAGGIACPSSEIWKRHNEPKTS